jgi:hypothetical protein
MSLDLSDESRERFLEDTDEMPGHPFSGGVVLPERCWICGATQAEHAP